MVVSQQIFLKEECPLSGNVNISGIIDLFLPFAFSFLYVGGKPMQISK